MARRRPDVAGLALCIANGLLLGGCPTVSDLSEAQRALPAPAVFPDSEVLASKSVAAAQGGLLEVSDPGHPLAGLRLRVRAGSYAEDRVFTLASKPVEPARLPAGTRATQPLIRIAGGAGTAAHPLELLIPRGAPGENEMAFLFDETVGVLEGLPTFYMDDTALLVCTRSVQDIVVLTNTDKPAAMKAAFAYDTGFTPGEDDWLFPNYGSYVAPDGFCSGSVVTAQWYYTRGGFAGQPPLRAHPALTDDTPLHWQDDAVGIRFASAAGDVMARSIRDVTRDVDKPARDPRLWEQIHTTLRLTGRPQVVNLFESPDARIGHTVLVTGAESDGHSSWLTIWDPNYPGERRRIDYVPGTGFVAYDGGTRAGGSPLQFGWVYFTGESALVDYDALAAMWPAVEDGTIGQAEFPATRLVAWAEEVGAWAPLDLEVPIVTTREDFLVRVDAEVHTPLGWKPGDVMVYDGLTGARISRYTTLTPGVSRFALMVIPGDGTAAWTGAHWITVDYTPAEEGSTAEE